MGRPPDSGRGERRAGAEYPAAVRCAAAVIIAAALLAGCAAIYPPAPLTVSENHFPYQIGPGDVLTVFVWRQPELSMSVPVRPDGLVSVPLAGDVPASGKESAALARDIEEALAGFVAEPRVTVIVTHFSGLRSQQIRVVGEAVKPMALAYVQSMTLLDVMIAVGGVTSSAAGNRAMILRTAEGNKQYSVRLRDLVKGGDMSANVQMRPGDVLVIPQGWF